jgi:FHA domain
MSDPRLCNAHLETPARREEFRQAREVLLGACGEQTLGVDQARPCGKAPPADAATSPPTRYWLVGRDNVYELKIGLNTIGRMSDNDVSVLDGGVSRRHCAIVVHVTKGCKLYDTASKNGTFLNGERVAGPAALTPGDRIHLYRRQFVFLAGDSTAPAPLGGTADDPDSRTCAEG